LSERRNGTGLEAALLGVLVLAIGIRYGWLAGG
jgi:hypothetical protein